MANKQVEGKDVETTIQEKIDQRHLFLNGLAQAESDFRTAEKPVQELREKLSKTQHLLSDKTVQRGAVISGPIKQTNAKLEEEITV